MNKVGCYISGSIIGLKEDKMEYLKDKLLDVISGGLPETEEMIEFCGSDGFADLLDSVMETIKTHITDE